MLRRLKISLILVLTCIVLVNCDYYTSVTGMENLLETESYMVEKFEKYLQAEELKNSHLRNYLNGVEILLENTKNNTQVYYDNPINSYKIIKRLARDWQDFVYANLELTNAEEYATSLTTWNNLQPNLDDLIGAAKGVARLQKTYGLDTMDIANGTLMGIKASMEMFATDCYELGKSLLQADDAKNAASWLIEARLRLAQERQNNDVPNFIKLNDETILQQLYNTTMKLGSAKLAFLLTSEKFNNDPKDEPATKLRSQFSTLLGAERLSRHASSAYNKTIEENFSAEYLYEQTCSGRLEQTPSEKRELRCRYQNNDVPFCLIAPFKVEELSLDPYVAYYHESIYENEIKQIFAAAEDGVKRSKVGDLAEPTYSDVRTSKNSWLYYYKHKFLNALERRLVDMTGLSMVTGEALQVANYGIGGHYANHYDFYEDEIEKDIDGNRILTALFYINDVELGGATAFPYLNLAVQPIRRSMVMWYNLHTSLELDYRTLHAGCPVIKGSKWICNEWFHSVDQEFFRPCDLEADGYKSIHLKGLEFS